MTDYKLAMRADEILKAHKRKGFPYVSDVAFKGIKADITGTVIYVGCGIELSSLFLFEDANCFIHQDLGDPKLFRAFQLLEQNGIISDFQVTSDRPPERRYEFRYKGQQKTVVEVFNTEENRNKQIYDGDVALNVHPLVEKGLGAIYFLAFPSQAAIKAIQLNLLPHLILNGIFEGSYYSRYFYGAEPSRLGLGPDGGTYRKRRHLTSEEIQRQIGFTIDDYIEQELIVSPWIFPKDKPKIIEEAKKRGVHFD